MGRAARPQARGEVHPVKAFLKEIGLQSYTVPLITNGFDDMEALLEAREVDLADVGLPRGHILKLLKRLRELGCDNGNAPQAEPVAVADAKETSKPLVVQPTGQMASVVQQSWVHVQKLGSDAVGDLLYKNLFTLAPEAMNLFPLHVRERYQHWLVDESAVDVELSPALRTLFGKIVAAVGYAVEHVQDIDKLKPALMALGARHFGYQCEAAHYQVLQKALIQTLAAALGDIFTAEVEFAWTVVYGFMSSVMLEGQQEAEAIKKAAAAAAVKVDPFGGHIATGNVISGGVEQYRIEGHLQKSSCGSVYEAVGVKSGQRFAVKAMTRELVQEVELLWHHETPLADVRFQEMTRGLPHVAQVQDHFSDDHYHFMVFDFASGGDLLQALRLRPGGFPERDAQWLIRGAAVGLASLQLRGLAMLDVSLENMLLHVREDASWHVCVCDLGHAASFVVDPFTGVEEPVQLKGLPGKAFRPPEMYAQGPVLASKVDAWCLGWSAFYLLAGQPLFHSTEEAAEDADWDLFKRGEVARLFKEKGWRSGLSPEARNFVLRLMHVDPRQRMSLANALQHPWLTNVPPAKGRWPAEKVGLGSCVSTATGAEDTATNVSAEDCQNTEKKVANRMALNLKLAEAAAAPAAPTLLQSMCAGDESFGKRRPNTRLA